MPANPTPTTPVPERAALRLVSHSQPAAGAIARATVPATAERGAPAIRRAQQTSGSRLAAATGAAYSEEPGGMETVVFPRPMGAAGSTIFRDDAAADPAPAPAATPAPAAPPAPSGGGGGGGGDIDEIYDQVIERLRRDLLADRERMGDVLGDLP
jgi:hypothetical protein